MSGRPGFLIALVAVALVLGFLGGSGGATAHADFLTSIPDPYAIWNIVPSYVSVTVSEAVQPGSPSIIVTNLTGERVSTGVTQLSPTDPTTFRVNLISGIGASVYTVTWVAVSADDGHFTSGTFYFMVTRPDGSLPGQFPQTGTFVLNQPLSPTDIALEAANFLGFAASFGALLLVGLLWVPLTSSLEPPERAGPTAGFRALLGLARWGAVVFTVAVAGLWIENLIRVPPAGVGGLVGSTFLLARALQIAAGAVLIVLVTRLLGRIALEDASGELPWEFLPLIFAGFVVILLEVAASHSQSQKGWWPLGPIADAVHLYGAALWVGGLVAIVRARPWLRAPTPPAFSRDLLLAFSRFALLGAFLVVTAGVLLGLVLVGSLDGLIGTPYGWIVLAKGSLLVPMVALGAWNRRTLGRKSAEGTEEAPKNDRVVRNVRAEAVMGAIILVLAGLLVTVNPATAPQPVNPSFLAEATSGGIHAIFGVHPYPSTPADYFIDFTVYYAANGTPFLSGGNGTLTMRLVGGNATGFTVPLDGPHENHYFVLSVPLDTAGTWEIEADIHGPSGAPVTLAFSLAIHP